MSIGAIHFVHNNLIATKEAIKSFRKIYPTNSYILIGDCGVNHYDLSTEYNCSYFHSNIHLGYPNNHFGYSFENILEYLKRIYIACNVTNSTHLILMEDDIKIVNDIKFYENTEMFATLQSNTYLNGSTGNVIDQRILNLINFNPLFQNNWYAAGGGCIFRVKTFLENYHNFLNFYINFFKEMQNIQSIIGWPDFTLNLFYLFCGKSNCINDKLYEFKNNHHYDDPELLNRYDILHHYKKFYQ